jgi:Tfp pilus assembly protein PilP
MMRLTLVLGLVAALALAACGESAQDKAKKQVCSARDDIQKQVNELKSLTPATATTSGIKDNLTAIQNDLNKIADAQGDLNADRKKQVQQANDKFVSEFKSIASNLGSNLSVGDARAQLKAAAQQLASAYQSSFAGVNCD